jgi:dipeptidyl aminopeptidase/acylaminoacyl peptidase
VTVTYQVPRGAAALLLTIAVSIDLAAAQSAKKRSFRPDDMFRIRRLGVVAWSPDAKYAAVEITKTGRWLDSVPASDLVLVDVRARTLRPISPPSAAYVGFFNALWSPDSRRLAFLSIDARAHVRLWVWRVGTAAPRLVPNVDVRVGNAAEPPLAWIDGNRLAAMTWAAGAPKHGLLYYRVLRGRNAADAWKLAIAGHTTTASAVESGRADAPTVASTEILALDLATGARTTLARGALHRLSIAADGCCVSFLRESPGIPGEPASSYIDRATRAKDAEAGYAAVNWGTEADAVDARTGARVAVPPAPPRRSPPKIDSGVAAPRSDARVLSVAPEGAAALYVAHGSDGSHLWIAGGDGRPLSSSHEVWRANDWMRDVQLGRAESFAYTSADGAPLTGWMLLPPDYAAGTKAPAIAIVYPGSVYGSSTPSSFSAYQANFEHPQLFAALGYVVLLPSMPAPANPNETHALAPLLSGVIPALDAAIARGTIDPDRIGAIGQSDGGFAVLGLIAQTNRFRSAIASAGFSNFVSLYGTFYGQYRNGDGGRPEAAQVLRILQMEQGAMGLGGPPWEQPDRYRDYSPLTRVDKVETPLMLVHGDLDFIPIQQAEEFFTGLFRQDKRAILVRYAGEGHTIADRANVLDLWTRLQRWLADTLAPRR